MTLSIAHRTPISLMISGTSVMWKGIQSCLKMSLFGLMRLLTLKHFVLIQLGICVTLHRDSTDQLHRALYSAGWKSGN